jgi:uncharacterized membrane-anchored protein YhcB (DUF1043 family)
VHKNDIFIFRMIILKIHMNINTTWNTIIIYTQQQKQQNKNTNTTTTMKSLKRFTQTVKRTVNTSTQHKDNEYQVLMNLAAQQEKTLTSFDKHVGELVKHVQGEMQIVRNCANDYKLIYVNESSPSFEDLPLVKEMQTMVDKHESVHVNPFVTKCQSDIQQPIRDYLQELNEASKGAMIKQRHKKQLDYEYHRDKYNTLQSKTSSQPTQVEEAKRNYENAKHQFEDMDEQAKIQLRQVVVKRYTVFHPIMIDLFGKVMSEYYINLTQFGQLLQKLNTIQAPPDTMYTASYADDYSEEYSMPVVPPKPSPRSATALPPPPKNSVQIPHHLDVEWFYLDDQHNQLGPVGVADLQRLMKNGSLNVATYVCNSNMSNWEPVGQHEVFKYVQ